MESNNQEPLSDIELDNLLAEWRIEPSLRRVDFARLDARRRHAAVRMRLAAAAALVIAVGGVLMLWPRRAVVDAPPVAESGFTAVPYSLPLGDGETASVVRMNLPVAALQSMGLPMPAADPNQTVTADVVIREDGRPVAVRLVSTRVSSN
jgi:hypothetical protein